MIRSRFFILTLLCLFFVCLCRNATSVDVTTEQQATLLELNAKLRQAGSFYVDRKFVECAAELSVVRDELRKLLQSQDPALSRLAKPIYQRLAKAGALLNAQGVSVEALPEWAEFSRAPDATNVEVAKGEGQSAEQANSGSPTDRVSFSRQIAPLLLENCNGCHLGGRRASGNLSFATYNALRRGGDSGEVITQGDAAQSLLIRKVKGEEGQRMPAGGRPPLSDDDIELLATWVQQGAEFDGPGRDTDIATVVGQAWAAEASHAELFDRRQSQALQRWSKVLPDATPQVVAGPEVIVVGNVPSSRVEETLERFEQAIKQVKKQFQLPAEEPLLKGGLSVFVFRSRYDYSEFGRMIENRELPKDWLGHWHVDALNAYAVTLGTDMDDKQASALALQLTAGAYLGGFRNVPTWFAEGVARNLVASTFRRGDARVAQWQQALPVALLKVGNARDILEQRLDEETAGVLGMGLTGYLMDRKNRNRFTDLLELLQSGRSFDDALTFAFASPEAIVKTWLGK